MTKARLAAGQVQAALEGFRYREKGIMAAVQADDLGAIIKALGLSQTAAARIAHCHRVSMSNWCRKGGAPIHVRRMMTMWAMLGTAQRAALSVKFASSAEDGSSPPSE